MVSSLEEYDGKSTLKHKIVKLLPLDYGEESKRLLKEIE